MNTILATLQKENLKIIPNHIGENKNIPILQKYRFFMY
jgi:hypothetical protein